KEAKELFEALYKEGHRDPETLGMYGRTLMDLYDKSGDINLLQRSRDLYAEAFETVPTDYYTGINAAAKSVFLGERDKARDYNQRVQGILEAELEKAPNDYWLLATLGETKLIEENYEKAAAHYH